MVCIYTSCAVKAEAQLSTRHPSRLGNVLMRNQLVEYSVGLVRLGCVHVLYSGAALQCRLRFGLFAWK